MAKVYIILSQLSTIIAPNPVISQYRHTPTQGKSASTDGQDTLETANGHLKLDVLFLLDLFCIFTECSVFANSQNRFS